MKQIRTVQISTEKINVETFLCCFMYVMYHDYKDKTLF